MIASIARCEGCSFDACEGWVLTYRDDICPCETPLTAEQRQAVGLPPDEWAHLNRERR